MNRLFYHMRKPSSLILSGMLMVSCTDSDFDLSHIDTTIGIGSEALQLPVSNSKKTIVSVLRRFLLISHHSLFLGNTTIS